MPKMRKERRKARKEHYLDGRARNPHHHMPVLKQSLEEARRGSGGEESPSTFPNVCQQCKPVLSRYADMFKEMVHHGSELKRRVANNPHPDFTHYRDLVSQNDWLRENMFDTLGNYLYCGACIRSALGVSKDRLTRQRNIKRLQSQLPIVEMAKSQVEQQRLGSFVLMPQHLSLSFSKWWRSEPPTKIMQVT